MAIYVTGDIHSNPRRFRSKDFPDGKKLTKDDYLVILGDFGLVWSQEESLTEEYWLNWLNDKPWTTLFIDGNHENFDRLDAYPVSYWNGGYVHKIRESVIHLMRGYVFDIDGQKCFCMGGAPSHDIKDGVYDTFEAVPPHIRDNPYSLYRINHLSWWAREIPSAEEYNRAEMNLALNHYEVDFIFTHETSKQNKIFLGYYDFKNGDDETLAMWLNEMQARVKYKKWYCGHYHMNRNLPDNCVVLYEGMDRIN